MTRSEIVRAVAAKTPLTQAEVDEVLDVFIETVAQCLEKGEKASIKGLMSLEPRLREARNGRNPKTGEIVTFPPVRSIICRMSGEIMNRMNGK